MVGKEVEITFCDVQRTKKKYKFTDEERLSFVLFGILYASRCNNFHGNVAARMNSINANKDAISAVSASFADCFSAICVAKSAVTVLGLFLLPFVLGIGYKPLSNYNN